MFFVNENDNSVSMIEGDWGINLPIEIETDIEFSENDNISIKIYDDIKGNLIIEKNYHNIEDNTIDFSLTKEESYSLELGRYYYDIDLYREGVFFTNILASRFFYVEEKAGEVNNESSL